jgi:enediyne polyketide synthase
LQNLLSTIDPERLRLLITFGSIIARTGLHGEADYALANEWLTELTANWRAEHPHCQCLAVEWSVWSGVGMGERLGRIDALRRQGITPISPDEGVRVLRQLIASAPNSDEGLASGRPTAVVVSGRFGDPPTLGHEQPELPLLRFLENPRLHVPGVELICDVTLSLGADPYLRDHAYRDMPLLPAVMGLEAMAQVSMALSGATMPPNFEDVELSRPVTVPASENRTIRLAALVRAPGKIEVVLRSDETGFQADHFRAICRFDAVKSGGSPIEPSPSGRGQGEGALAFGNSPSPQPHPDGRGSFPQPLLALNPRQDLYGRILFHRGRFQRVEGYRQLSATRCLAEVSPDGQARWFGGYLSETMLLGDPAMRDAAIHAIQACIPHGTILPVGIDRVFTALKPLAGPCVVSAEEREHSGDRFVYDLTISSADGEFCERWEGLRLQRVDTAAPAAHWAQPLLAPYLERRLGELVPGAATTVAVIERSQSPDDLNGNDAPDANIADADWLANRRQVSDTAIAAAVGESVTVLRRADGKPIVANDFAASVAHADSITLSVASSRSLVACDTESVVRRDSHAWTALLQPERVALARLIAEQSPADEFDAAATRVWSAGECLNKAGLRFDAPLVLRETTPDRWVTLAAGAATIATWVGAVGDAAKPLAVALLVGSRDEVL